MYKVLPDTKKESIIFYYRIAWSVEHGAGSKKEVAGAGVAVAVGSW